MSNFIESAMEAIRDYVEQEFEGNRTHASRALGMQGDTLHKWLRGESSPTLVLLGPVLDKIDARIILPQKSQSSSNTRITNSGMVPAGKQQALIASLENQVRELTLERQELRGEIKALERQIERLTPAPEQPYTPPISSPPPASRSRGVNFYSPNLDFSLSLC